MPCWHWKVYKRLVKTVTPEQVSLANNEDTHIHQCMLTEQLVWAHKQVMVTVMGTSPILPELILKTPWGVGHQESHNNHEHQDAGPAFLTFCLPILGLLFLILT